MEHDEKQNVDVSPAWSPITPGAVTSPNTGLSLAQSEKRDLQLKKWIRILKFLMRVLSIILDIFMVGSMSNALANYYLTRNEILPGNVPVWPTPTTLWPTFMLLAISIIGLSFDVATITAYCCGVGAANKVGNLTSYVHHVLLVVQIVAWVAATRLYEMSNTDHGLWGYSCLTNLENAHQNFENFGMLCDMQTATWGASITQTIAKILQYGLYLFMLVRYLSKRKIANLRASLSMEPGNGEKV